MNYGKKIRILSIIATIAILFILPWVDVLAAWNTPSCDPDTDPTAAACNVSAPINVANVDQTKAGALTIQSTLTSQELQVGGAVGGTGNVAIDANSGIGLDINHTSSSSYAIYAVADSNMVYTSPAFYFRQEGAGTSLGAYSASGIALGAVNGATAYNVSFATPTEAVRADGPTYLEGDTDIIGVTDITGDTYVTGNTELDGDVDILGPTFIDTDSGDLVALDISHNDTTSYAINVESSASAKEAIAVMNDSSGGGIAISVNSGEALSTENANSGNNVILGSNTYAADLQGPNRIGTSTSKISSGDALEIYVDGSSTDGISITGTNSARGMYISSTGISSTGQRIVTTGSSAKGIDISTGSTGIGINVLATSGYAGKFSSSSTLSSTVAALTATNSGTGTAIYGTAGTATGTIAKPGSTFATVGSEGVRGKSTSSYGVLGYSESSTGNGGGVYGTSSADIGVLAHSDANYGLYSNSDDVTTFYGGLLCNQETNCAYLGGPTYAGLFEYRVKVEADVARDSIVEVNNTNNSASPGYGLVATTASGSWTPTDADEGTAVAGYGYAGQGVYGMSDQSYGVEGLSDNSSGVFGGSDTMNKAGVEGEGFYGVMGKATGGASWAGVYGDQGSGNYGVQGEAVAGSAVYGSATTGHAGEFITSGATGTTLSVESTDTGNALKVGIQVDAQGTGTTGIDVDVANKGNGIDVDVSDYSSSLQANGGYIQGYAAFNGGQFYPNENAGNGLFGAWFNQGNINVGAPGSFSSMLFDGSDIWALQANGWLYRRNAVDMRNVLTYDLTENVCRTMALGGNIIYIPCGSNVMRIVDLYDDVTIAVGVAGMPGLPLASVFDSKNRLWVGFNSGNIGYIDTTAGTYTPVVGGYTSIQDMTVSDGFIWAIDSGTNKVIRIDYNSMAVTEITDVAMSGISSIIYDGAYIWVTSKGNDYLFRINETNDAIKQYPLTNAVMTSPIDMVYDGSRIWIAFGGSGGANFGWGKFAVSDEQFYPYSVGVSNPTKIIFDGTYLWTGENNGDIERHSTGTGYGHAATNVTRGFYIYGYDNQLHCVYINSAGNLQADVNLGLCKW